MRISIYLIFCSGMLIINGCHNNAHLRTQKKLDKGESVISSSVVGNIGGMEKGFELNAINRTGILGSRLEISYLRGTGSSELGPYFSVGSDYHDVGFNGGFDYRAYVLGNGKYNKKAGFQIEYNYTEPINNNFVKTLHLRPSISTITDENKSTYMGIHGIIASGQLSDEVWWYERDTIRDPNGLIIHFDYPDFTEQVEYRYFSYGAGLTAGYEYRPKNFKSFKDMNIQIQFDVSLIQNTFDTDFTFPNNAILGLDHYSKDQLDGVNYSTGPVFLAGLSIGTNFFKPKKLNKDLIKPLPIPKIFDPETGEKIKEKNDTTTHKPIERIESIKGMKPIESTDFFIQGMSVANNEYNGKIFYGNFCCSLYFPPLGLIPLLGANYFPVKVPNKYTDELKERQKDQFKKGYKKQIKSIRIKQSLDSAMVGTVGWVGIVAVSLAIFSSW